MESSNELNNSKRKIIKEQSSKSDKFFSSSQPISQINQSALPYHLPMIYSTQKFNNHSLTLDPKQYYSLSPTMQRMISSLNAEDNEKHHRKNIERQVNYFKRYQNREEEVYLRTAFKHHKIVGLGQRVKDDGVIEAITNAKNDEWRKLVLDEKVDPHVANEKTCVASIRRIQVGKKYTDYFSERASSFSRHMSDIETPNKNICNFQLPNERKIINEERKRRMKGPVLYWGCGEF